MRLVGDLLEGAAEGDGLGSRLPGGEPVARRWG
jgi:hypothetical protein